MPRSRMKIMVKDRKIRRAGRYSLDVIVPAMWVQMHKIKVGDNVRVEILDSGDLLIGVVRR